MKEKMIKLLLKKNLILDFNDCCEDYFDEYFYQEESNLISTLKELVKLLFG